VWVRIMVKDRYLTIPEFAKLLGVSRIAIYNRVRRGKIPATKIGRSYVIRDQTITTILGKRTTRARKKRIDAAVRRTVQEYGEVLKLLGKDE
jgi:excisionase family DNA binding protein